MIIQHNISALNSYRNLTNNNSAVSSNLEKLSSGYAINRAGDDAAGLAISEKMRAQITGLETAQKNANDGISLVQTAEGALQEVHTMLNRMVELAQQSANGTYQDEVDRENLESELTSLKDEINRISESTNFNGINLLDGSLSGAEVVTTEGTTTAATAATVTIDLNTVIGAGGIADGKKFVLGDITVTGTNTTTTDLATAITQIQSDIATAGNEITIDNVDYSAELGDDGILKLTAKNAEETDATNADFTAAIKNDSTALAEAQITELVNGTDEVQTAATTTVEFAKNMFSGDTVTINGKVYEFVNEAGDETKTEGAVAVTLGSDLNATLNNLKTEVDKDAAAGGFETNVAGNNFTITTTATGDGTTAISAEVDGGLRLQIGDTSDDFNQLKVAISSVDTATLGIADISIKDQTSAKAAVSIIKDAINKVSSTRGDLGAIQNRLEHTINNLSVTTENMTAAESRIRDVDMAKEMMEYTKNNILVQSSQAMLAQANQIPQGVLQLLQ